MSTKYKVYDSYKDTGIKWIKKVPAHWGIEKGKWLFVKQNRPIREFDGIVTAFRDGQVTLRANRRTDGFTNALKEHGYQGVRKGDLVIHAMDAFAGAIGVSDSDGKSTPVYSVCTPRQLSKVNTYYYGYFLRNLSKMNFIESLAKGIRERSTDFRFPDFGEVLLPLPSLEEQEAIASFLDRETGKIDDLIAKQERLIELLEEKRQAVISHAVTKGLDPNVPLKDSGVEWLGDIPEHWEVKKLNYIFRMQSGDFVSANEIETHGKYPVYGGNGLRGYTKKKNHRGDYILIGRQGALCGNIKQVSGEFWATEHALVVYPIYDFNLNWLAKTLHAMNLNQYSTSAAQPGLSVEQLSILRLPFPQLNEQFKINEHISDVDESVNKLVARAQSAIDLLKERRTALISAAVTGKIDVRGQLTVSNEQ